MNFQKDKYQIIKKAVSKELTEFLFNYFLMKRQVAKTCFQSKFISPFEVLLGTWSDEQIPNTYSSYSDIAMETLMLKCQTLMEKATKLKLSPSYSYARIYKKGDELKRHKDRFSCEISTTMNLGGDDWPIYLSPNENVGVSETEGGIKGITSKSNARGIKIDLKPGDMLIYSGCELEHWREKFKGKDCAQVFLHYNNRKTTRSKNNLFDKRLHLGLPSWFKR